MLIVCSMGFARPSVRLSVCLFTPVKKETVENSKWVWTFSRTAMTSVPTISSKDQWAVRVRLRVSLGLRVEQVTTIQSPVIAMDFGWISRIFWPRAAIFSEYWGDGLGGLEVPQRGPGRGPGGSLGAKRPKAEHFLRAILAIAILSVHLSVRLSVRPSITRVDQAKTVQARITTSSPSAAWKTLVSACNCYLLLILMVWLNKADDTHQAWRHRWPALLTLLNKILFISTNWPYE